MMHLRELRVNIIPNNINLGYCSTGCGLYYYFTCGFNAMYIIGLMHTDNLTVIVGTMESIGPITLKT